MTANQPLQTYFQELADEWGRFDLCRWRALVDAAGRVASAQQVIVPFGFEVLGEERYLLAPLLRLSIYCCAEDPRESSAQLADSLLTALAAEAPAFYATIGVMWGPEGAVHRSAAPAARRQLSVWPIPPGAGSLEQRWADYLLASPAAVSEGRLRESTRLNDHHALRYLLQLCLIQEAVFGDRVGHLETRARKHLLAQIRALENDGRALTSGAREFDAVCRPYAERIASYLRGAGTAVENQEALDFHSGELLNLLIAPAECEVLRQRVVDTYRSFGAAPEPRRGAGRGGV